MSDRTKRATTPTTPEDFEVALHDGKLAMYGGQYDDLLDHDAGRYTVNARRHVKTIIRMALAAGYRAGQQAARAAHRKA